MENKIVNVCFSSSDSGEIKQYLYMYHEKNSNDPFWEKYRTLSTEEKMLKINEASSRMKAIVGEYITLEFDLNIGNISGDFRQGRLDVEKMLYEPWGVKSEEIEEILENKMKGLNDVKTFAEQGYTIRVWSYGTNFSECGLAFLVTELQNMNAHIEIAFIQIEDWRRVDINKLKQASYSVRKVTSDEKKKLIKIWSELKEKDTGLRFLTNGEIINVPITYFDDKILEFVENRKRKVRSVTITGHILGNTEQYVQSYFIQNRIKTLVDEGKLQNNGIVKGSCYEPDIYVTLKRD